MIKINLASSDKNLDSRSLRSGKSKINVRSLILFLSVILIFNYFVDEDLKKKNGGVDKKSTQLKKEISALKKEIQSIKGTNQDYEILKQKEEELGQKLQIVKKLIKLKMDPQKLLLFISKNIPQGLWLSDITIVDATFKIMGHSMETETIQKFYDELKNATFFSGEVFLSEEEDQIINNQRVKVFTMNAQIKEN